MTKSALKKERINIYMDINQLKELVKEKKISNCQETAQEKLQALEKQRKDQLMLEAANDPEFLMRCEEIQNDFAAIDFEVRKFKQKAQVLTKTNGYRLRFLLQYSTSSFTCCINFQLHTSTVVNQ